MTNVTLLVVSSLLAAGSPEWCRVPAALSAKHAHEARVTCVTADPSVTNALGQIRLARPTHVAFVMGPEEVDFAMVVALKRMMRDVDDDPYEDSVWGIVTGPTADDALRIASSDEPRVIHAALTTTGVDDDLIAGPITCLADSHPAGRWYVKDESGRIPVFKDAVDYKRLTREAKAFKPYAKVADKKKALGRLWDRDATVFYGDPLHKVYLKR